MLPRIRWIGGFDLEHAPPQRKKPTRRDVIRAFRLILGRPPENEAVIRAHKRLSSVAELGKALLESDEFAGKYKSSRQLSHSHPNVQAHRRTIVLIHLQKTGGTSLREIIGRHFPADRRCPVIQDKLHLLSLGELANYDFYSGHFDVSILRFIPRNEIETVAFFREPRARLISLYRFLRSHPLHDEFEADRLIPLAHQLSAEQFFELPLLRSYSAINNHYLVAMGRSFTWFDSERETLTESLLSNVLLDAQLQIAALTGLGITEYFEDSVALLCRRLGFPLSPAVAPKHVTDGFAKVDHRFRVVEPVEMTPRLDSAMADLVRFDSELYRYAVRSFYNRSSIITA